MNNIKSKFGNKLRELRKRKGLSQENFAGLADIDRTYIADIENGKRNVSIIIVEKIAKAFEISISDLFSDIE
ncbi:MAG: transcriptional regulator with XRE-family HTH domain [Urechidicola sp.]|jgi:transcriptional regulator with XRE-family HTH domain